MDSKSIAREGVPVRLRDPVLNPDETFGFVGVFLSAFRFLAGKAEVGRKGAARCVGRNETRWERRVLVLSVKTVATVAAGLHFCRATKKRPERQEKGFFP